MKNGQLADIRKGYKQGKVGAHTDGGMEQVRGRSVKGRAREGHAMGKQPKAHSDGGYENARGRPNHLFKAGHSTGYDPTIKRPFPQHIDHGFENARGRSGKMNGER